MPSLSNLIAVNSILGGNNTGPTVAALTTGRIIVAFETTHRTVSALEWGFVNDPPIIRIDNDIDGVFVSATGQTSAQFEISLDVPAGQVEFKYVQNTPTVAATLGGDFAIAYTDLFASYYSTPSNAASVPQTVVRRYDGATGFMEPGQVTVIPRTQLNGSQNISTFQRDIVALNDGSILVGYHDSTLPDAAMLSGDPSDSGIYQRTLSVSNVLGGFQRVNTITVDDQRNLDYANAPNGDILAVYMSEATGLNTPSIMASINGFEFSVDAASINLDGQATKPRAAFIDADSFVVAYQLDYPVPSAPSNYNIAFKIFNINGTEELGRTDVTLPGAGSLVSGHPQIAAAGGKFLITWVDHATKLLKGQVYTAAGVPDGGVLNLSSGATMSNVSDRHSVTALPDGRFFVAWTYQDSSLSNAAMVAGVFVDARDSGIVLLGTAEADQAVGTAFSDTMSGDVGNDTLYGGGGGDSLTGNDGADTLYGQEGADTLSGRAGADNLYGGNGGDTLDGGTGVAGEIDYARYDDADYGNLVINLTNPGSNTGAAAGDVYFAIEGLVGGVGNDTITGDNNANRLWGMSGSDTIFGGGGNDTLYGGDSGDNLYGGSGADRHEGGAGFDYARYDEALHGNIVINLANSTLNTGAALGDTYVEIEGVVGGTGNDTITGDTNANALWGLDGNDWLSGGDGGDTLYGGSGADNLSGGSGADAHNGGSQLAGTYDYARYDDANHGNLVVNLLNPALNTGAAAGDTYSGIEGIVGGVGNDTITGDNAANRLWGVGGTDFIYGKLGNDTLYGGAGVDRFYFDTTLDAATNMDTIADFSPVDDFLMLENAIFTGLTTTGFLAANRFTSVAAGGNATTVDHRIVYEQTTGKLFYDADGSGAGAKIQFAQLTAGTALTAADIWVY